MMQQEDEEQTGAAEPAVPEPKDTNDLEQALAEEKEKAAGYLANWQRTEADLANYKRRSEQEKQEIAQFANTSLILNILPALDDMERAFASLPSRTVHQEWVKGIKLVGRKLLIVRQSDETGTPFGKPYVAVDTLDAGIGDLVLTAHGSGGRQTKLTKNSPVDAVIMAVIDHLEVGGEVVYRKERSY